MFIMQLEAWTKDIIEVPRIKIELRLSRYNLCIPSVKLNRIKL